MPSKDKKVVGVKLTEKEYQMLETYVNTHNMTISSALGLCVKGLLDGDLKIEKGELKTGVDPIGYEVSEEVDTPFGQQIERKLDILRQRGYPEKVIYQMKEDILNGIESRIDMLPKKYDARKMRNDDCGC